jgi:hypothetical protein
MCNHEWRGGIFIQSNNHTLLFIKVRMDYQNTKQISNKNKCPNHQTFGFACVDRVIFNIY